MITDAWECFAFCQNHEPCLALTHLSNGFRLSLKPSHSGLRAAQLENTTTLDPVATYESLRTLHLQEMTEGPSTEEKRQNSLSHAWGKEKEDKDMAEGAWSLEDNQTMVYVIRGVDKWPGREGFNVR